jgi:hypothetical protein
VRPGDVLTLECVVETVRGPVGRGKVKATVEGQLAVRGTLTFAVGQQTGGVGSTEPPTGGSTGFAGAGAAD